MRYASVAQLVERAAVNREDFLGSSPSWGAIKI